jgi:hypothetical protein
MRIACCLALAALGISAAPAAAQEPDARKVLLAFVPTYTDRGLLEEFADAGLAVGVSSPASGGPRPAQPYLDLGQGTRVSWRVYDDELRPLQLEPDGRLTGWEAVVERAEDAPGDVIPGLLGETVRAAGLRTGYAGLSRLSHDEAAAIADRAGRIDTVSLGPRRGFGTRVARLLDRHALVAARLPLGTRTAILDDVPPDVFVVLVRAPRPDGQSLLPSAATLGDDGGLLTSRTTRRDGMVAITDYAPTILRELGLEAPDEMQGRPIRATGGSWEDARSLSDRLAHIKGRRSPALRLALGAWLLALAALALAGRARLGLRLGLLAAMWLPGVALVTGAIDPARTAETVTLALAPLVLALVTDRLAGWPRAPAVPAAVVLASHAVDLIAGSPLIVRSLAGPNPAFGARFWGIGNELEAILSAMVLLGAGAFLAGRRGRAVPVGFAVACAAAALFMGAGRLGADVGGVITLAVGGAAAVLASLPGGVTRRAVAIAVVTPALGLAALVAVDVVTGGDAHLTRSVLDADSPGELVDIVERRFEISWESLKQGTTPVSVALFAIALGYGVARRRAVLAPLHGERAFAAGMWGTLAATVVGALANDSGPTIFLVGAAALVLAGGYLRGGKPPAGVLT